MESTSRAFHIKIELDCGLLYVKSTTRDVQLKKVFNFKIDPSAYIKMSSSNKKLGTLFIFFFNVKEIKSKL